ncbi:hypothetical protein GGR54DRAFT_637895 [Hypoxylon sp. NC1633]|nr:hypothetical protein GGR54DRAFT_637895 [Hypoxylon sp. NC1633]
MARGHKDALARARSAATAALAIATLASAAPLDYFPINSQLPPVARISAAFEFVFSPLTFSSPLNVTYRLENAPSWLSIDSASRRIYGTPGEEDVPPGEVVGVPIELVAEDETGSTAANSTLVVSRNPPPVLSIPVSRQLPEFGTYIAPSSLHLRPSEPFSFSFDEHTFRTDSGDGGLNYYAVSGDNVPLPSWITFDSGTLTFSGETPPFESLVQPPESFTFLLVASDVVGFASVSVPFSIMVGIHELAADPPVVKANATHGKPFEYEGLPDVLKLDKQPLKQENISSIAALDLPPWLAFDNETWKLNGTPESGAESTNITVAIVDKYFDYLNLTISIKFGLFLSDLPDLNLKPGKDFSFDLKKYLSNSSDIEVKVDDDPDAPWARFNSSSLILSGSVPDPSSAKSATAPRVSFRATSKQSNDTETKTLNIHVNSPSSSPTTPPQPSGKATESGNDDSNKNLLWLLVIPILLAFIGIVLLLFYIRRRRQGPNRINIRQVSGPVPGSFMANGSESLAQNSAKRMADVDVSRPSDGGASIRNSNPASNQRASRSAASPSLSGSGMPHAVMAMYSRARSPEHSVILEASSSWSAGQGSISSTGRAGATDEASLLSDTSLGEGEAHIAEAFAVTRRTRDGAFSTLGVPKNREPFSIQTTPEIAYIAGGKYDSGSDEAVPPAVGYAVRPKPGHQEELGQGLRGIGKRISNIWKRESPSKFLDDPRRHSIQSTSTNQTTATSILTSGISGGAEEQARTSTNIVARPTIIHIPSRPGETRHMSRRIDESSPLFGGRSVMTSPRNFGMANQLEGLPLGESPELPPNLEDFAIGRDSDTSWDRLARNSLGIAYKDLLTEPEKVIPRQETMVNIAREDNWIRHDIMDLLSPGQWPKPSTSINMVGIAKTSPANTSSELPQLPPVTAQVAFGGGRKSRVAVSRRLSQSSGVELYRSPSASSKSDRSYVYGDDQLPIHRTRSGRTPGSVQALASQTPSPENGWAPPTRPLPETPTRPARVPLGNRPNEASYYIPGVDAQSSKKSWKTTRSMKSAKSTRSVWADEDDEDAWEDVRPPTTVVDGWDDGGDSDGSFAVYI